MMQKPTLVIMAAGMGSRFGGLKQMTPVDSQGHFIMDYSIYDALQAGFGRIVCIIKEEMQADFEEKIGSRVRPHAELVYAYQSLDELPEGYMVPEGRVKPWGTAHAVYCARSQIAGPFAVINADDFYGRDAFAVMGRFLQASHGSKEHAMMGYALGNTLTENGSVSRGICTVDEKGYLTAIAERTRIVKTETGAAYTEDGETYTEVSVQTPVSMNMWGFQPSVLNRLDGMFREFLEKTVPQNPMKAEFYLPLLPGRMLADGTGMVQVLTSAARWHGITYQEDLPAIRSAIAAMQAAGQYPQQLWKQDE